jgi:hypothetical protein
LEEALEADISILRKTGHFYFALTGRVLLARLSKTPYRKDGRTRILRRLPSTKKRTIERVRSVRLVD